MFHYLSHPQVDIDPNRAIELWRLNAEGRDRTLSAAKRDPRSALIISSAETKAVETAAILAAAWDVPMCVDPRMHENDRTSTGFLRPDAFEAAVDAFFAHPMDSFKGWEIAKAAQDRIVGAVHQAIERHKASDITFVGHGGVGTLLYCHLCGLEISRSHDQGPGGGGNVFSWTPDQPPRQGWRPMEDW